MVGEVASFPQERVAFPFARLCADALFDRHGFGRRETQVSGTVAWVVVEEEQQLYVRRQTRGRRAGWSVRPNTGTTTRPPGRVSRTFRALPFVLLCVRCGTTAVVVQAAGLARLVGTGQLLLGPRGAGGVLHVLVCVCVCRRGLRMQYIRETSLYRASRLPCGGSFCQFRGLVGNAGAPLGIASEMRMPLLWPFHPSLSLTRSLPRGGELSLTRPNPSFVGLHPRNATTEGSVRPPDGRPASHRSWGPADVAEQKPPPPPRSALRTGPRAAPACP